MEAQQRTELEREIRRLAESADLAGAAEVAIRGYGGELFGFLMAFHRDETAASEVFSDATERIWTGLAQFKWQSSFRTWAYSVARNAALTYQRDTRRRRQRNPELPPDSALSAIADQVRTTTLSFMKTDAKTRAVALRESLSREDQEILVLRIDRGLAWNDLAQILYEGEAPLDAQRVRREATRLRKRFQVAKERLVDLARREGLVGGGTVGP